MSMTPTDRARGIVRICAGDDSRVSLRKVTAAVEAAERDALEAACKRYRRTWEELCDSYPETDPALVRALLAAVRGER